MYNNIDTMAPNYKPQLEYYARNKDIVKAKHRARYKQIKQTETLEERDIRIARQRQASREYYQKNKEAIAQRRKLKRQQSKAVKQTSQT